MFVAKELQAMTDHIRSRELAILLSLGESMNINRRNLYASFLNEQLKRLITMLR